MEPAKLSTADQRRLEKLAAAAGRTPQAMLKYVLRDGFEYTEEVVRKINEGLADLDTGRVFHGEQVHEEVRQIIKKHAGKKAA